MHRTSLVSSAGIVVVAALALALCGCVGVIEPGGPVPGGGIGGGGGNGGSGTGGSTHSSTISGSTCELGIDARHEIFIERCGACHGSASPSAGLDLVTKGAVARMLGKAAVSCGGQPLVTADGAGGVLFDRIEDTACGRVMPPGGAHLDRYELDCLYAYVANEVAQQP